MANTLYWVTYSSALSAPSGAQIVAGHDINNNAGEAWGTGNAAWTGDGVCRFHWCIWGRSKRLALSTTAAIMVLLQYQANGI